MLDKQIKKMCKELTTKHPSNYCKFCGLRNTDCKKKENVLTEEEKKFRKRVLSAYNAQ